MEWGVGFSNGCVGNVKFGRENRLIKEVDKEIVKFVLVETFLVGYRYLELLEKEVRNGRGYFFGFVCLG